MTTQELRELDLWIAEHLFNWAPTYAIRKGDLYYRSGEHGYTRSIYEAGHYKKDRALSLLVRGEPMEIVPHERPNYSTDAKLAMDVLKKCAERICDKWDETNCIQIQFWDLEWHIADSSEDSDLPPAKAETLELAIAKFSKQLFSQTTK